MAPEKMCGDCRFFDSTRLMRDLEGSMVFPYVHRCGNLDAYEFWVKGEDKACRHYLIPTDGGNDE